MQNGEIMITPAGVATVLSVLSIVVCIALLVSFWREAVRHSREDK
jgi:Na+-transporting methylmalonyl-CoA/oxaloacetate decarboxylase gamma subunit